MINEGWRRLSLRANDGEPALGIERRFTRRPVRSSLTTRPLGTARCAEGGTAVGRREGAHGAAGRCGAVPANKYGLQTLMVDRSSSVETSQATFAEGVASSRREQRRGLNIIFAGQERCRPDAAARGVCGLRGRAAPAHVRPPYTLHGQPIGICVLMEGLQFAHRPLT